MVYVARPRCKILHFIQALFRALLYLAQTTNTFPVQSTLLRQDLFTRGEVIWVSRKGSSLRTNYVGSYTSFSETACRVSPRVLLLRSSFPLRKKKVPDVIPWREKVVCARLERRLFSWFAELRLSIIPLLLDDTRLLLHWNACQPSQISSSPPAKTK